MINTVPIHVRFFDIDINNHVNNSVYFTYMENARTDLLMDDFLAYKEQCVLFIVAEATCKFKRPIRLNDNVLVELEFIFSAAMYFNIVYTFKNAEGLIYAVGNTKMAMVNEASNRPIKIPQTMMDKYFEVSGK